MSSSSPSMRRVGSYDVGDLLGRGGMASVYDAAHAVTRQPVALKILHPHLAGSPKARARFMREASAGRIIDHPHVVRVLDVGNDDEGPFIAMERVLGPTLEQLLAAARPLRPQALRALGTPLLDALASAHRVGVAHRDLKPSNILLARAPDGGFSPRIADFGISKIAGHADDALTGDDAMLGTLDYVAPEQARRAHDGDAASDQFVLGLILYEAATGVLPHRGVGWYERVEAFATSPPEPPSRLVPGLPARFDDVVLRALRSAPGERFPSVDAMARAFADAFVDVEDGVSRDAPVEASDATLTDPLRAPAPAPAPSRVALPASEPANGDAAARRRTWRSRSAVAALATSGALLVVWAASSARPPSPQAVRATIAPGILAPVPSAREADPTASAQPTGSTPPRLGGGDRGAREQVPSIAPVASASGSREGREARGHLPRAAQTRRSSDRHEDGLSDLSKKVERGGNGALIVE